MESRLKFIILAAGLGARLFPLVENLPKSLLDLGNGITLLERQLNAAMASPEIKEVLIVTGYHHQKIESFLYQKNKKFKNVQLEYNPFFKISDNLMTLWTIRHHVFNNDFIISNGDNLYKDHVINHITENAQHQEGIFVTIDHKDYYDSDDMKVLLNDYGDVIRVHKQISPSEAMGESVGLVLVKGQNARNAFVKAVLTLVKNEGSLQYYWLETLNQLIAESFPIKSVVIHKTDWCELDFHPDVKLIRDSLLKNLF